MQKFGLGQWEFVKIILFFSLYHTTVFPMNMPTTSHSFFQAEKVITIFDSKKILETSSSWNEIVPGHILITPDEKGAIISEYNRVRHAQFDTGNIDIIIRHCGFIPLIATAQKQDGSLLVVSAGNYHCPQENKFVAEYVVYCNGASRFYQIDSPIQAISLNASGDILAIADLSSVSVIDLSTNIKNKASYKTKSFNDNWVMDIAIHPRGNGVIVAGSNGGLQWMTHEMGLSNLKQVKITDKIKKIYYPRTEDLLYVTNQGEAKVGKMKKLIEIDNDQTVDTDCFAEVSKYNNVVADLGEQIAVACWTDNTRMDQNIRQTIKIYRKDDTHKDDMHIDKFILKFSDLEESYNYKTLFGTRDSGIGHLLHVTLRNNTVVAVGTDGKMRVWSLPEKKHRLCDEVEKKAQEDFYAQLVEFNAARKAKEKDVIQGRRRSQSGSSSDKVPRKLSSGGEPDSGEKTMKKPSPRPIQVLQALSRPFSSRENSSVSSSRESSPTQSPHTPHRTDNRIDNRDNRTEKSEVTFAVDVKDYSKGNCEDKI